MWLFLAQRLSALVMAPLVILHLGVIIYAVRAGLSADAIFMRTRGSWLWGGAYGLFVLAVSVHATLGLRAIVIETLAPARRLDMLRDGLLTGFALLLLVLGMRAVAGVVL